MSVVQERTYVISICHIVGVNSQGSHRPPTQRAAWLPYFSDVQAVLFLAPISAFDERLAEDKRVNRLEDSFVLWQSIAKAPLLAKATIIRKFPASVYRWAVR